MQKVWIACLVVLIASFLVIRITDRSIHYQTQVNFDTTETKAYFDNQEVFIPTSLAELKTAPKVLGESTGKKTIYVDLSTQTLYAYEGENLVYTFLVSTGKWNKTPTGTFQIANKFRFIKMSGGSVALHDYYYLPNVPYTMFFGNKEISASRGFSLHGTYWHNNFGKPMSHGCVNLKTSEAGILYNWADPQLPEGKNYTIATEDNPGTTVIIYGTTPKS